MEGNAPLHAHQEVEDMQIMNETIHHYMLLCSEILEFKKSSKLLYIIGVKKTCSDVGDRKGMQFNKCYSLNEQSSD